VINRLLTLDNLTLACISAAILLTSCSSHTATGTAVGAAVGGGFGALTGTTEGALIGAGIGSGIGALVGNAADKRSQRYAQHEYGYGQGDITQAPHQQAQTHPWGKQRAPGVATSPYPPHHDIDIRGYKRGDLVVDPTTGGTFLVP